MPLAKAEKEPALLNRPTLRLLLELRNASVSADPSFTVRLPVTLTEASPSRATIRSTNNPLGPPPSVTFAPSAVTGPAALSWLTETSPTRPSRSTRPRLNSCVLSTSPPRSATSPGKLCSNPMSRSSRRSLTPLSSTIGALSVSISTRPMRMPPGAVTIMPPLPISTALATNDPPIATWPVRSPLGCVSSNWPPTTIWPVSKSPPTSSTTFCPARMLSPALPTAPGALSAMSSPDRRVTAPTVRMSPPVEVSEIGPAASTPMVPSNRISPDAATDSAPALKPKPSRKVTVVGAVVVGSGESRPMRSSPVATAAPRSSIVPPGTSGKPAPGWNGGSALIRTVRPAIGPSLMAPP